MSLLLATDDIQTNIPGAYNEVTVQSTPVGTGAVGNILIIGEAEGGPSLSDDLVALKDNSYSPTQLNKVAAKYLSGNVVEAMRALTTPANDPDIKGSASLVFIAKSNSSTKAQAIVDTDYGTLKDKNYGVLGNRFGYKVITVQAEVAPMLTGGTISSLGAPLNGITFDIRLNGGAATTVTLSGTPTDHDTTAHLATELNGQLPAGILAAAASLSTISLTMASDADANRKGYGKDFELVDTSPGDLAALGLSASLTVSSAEPDVELNVVRPDINANELKEASADVALTMGYAGGTTCTVTINATTLSTTHVGGPGSDFSVLLSTVPTLQALADFINSQTGYTAAVIGSTQASSGILDKVTAVGIASSAADLMPGRIKKAASNWNAAANSSRYLSFSQTALLGLPHAMTGGYVYLTGGAKGATSSASILSALSVAEGINANFIIPLFAQDASLDIPLGLTDGGSTYTIDAIHAAAKSHALKMSQIEMKKNREAMLAYEGTYATTKNKSGALATYRSCLCFQDCTNISATGTSTFQPWYAAVIAAGMQAAGFYKAIVKKGANIISFADPVDFDSGNPGDVSDALYAGLLFLENSRKGPRWVSDQTTYGFDTNFVYNSLQTTYIADIIDLTFTQDAEDAFVGQSLADIDIGTVNAFIATEGDKFKKLKLITSSDDAPLGYKNPSIEQSGPTLSIGIEFKPSSSIYFVSIKTNLSQVQRNG